MSVINMPHYLLAGAISLASVIGLVGCGGGADPTSTAEQSSPRTADAVETLQFPATAGMEQASSTMRRSFASSRLSSADAMTDRDVSANGAAAMAPVDRQDAFRFLSQATFGPSPGTIAELSAQTYDEWFDHQIAMPWRALQPRVKASYLEMLAGGPTSKVDRSDVISGFWREALTSDAQLRWRIAYAWSQIFVYSVNGSVGLSDPIGSASYFDMLARNGLGTYRELLESVARHPMMGRYLSHLGNQPADDLTGRVPDENFAREVMQLFSIGLYKLNLDGTPKLDVRQHRIPTYDADDVAGLARVFTGLSWNCGEGRTKECFTNWFGNMDDPYVGSRQMVSYVAFHSKEEKRFLGEVIPAQSVANPEASLKIALDALANHPNVGPFIGRQLIQRLVTSNPSPTYVAAAAAAFNDNGKGYRGDLSAVVRTILTHKEARVQGAHEGKVREPVLLLTALARALPVYSVTGKYMFRSNEAYDYALGQIPLFSPSVFNYYRPGFVPRGGGLGLSDMVGPELQIVDENSVASYVRFMRRAIQGGFGRDIKPGAKEPDMRLDLGGLTPLADKPDQLMDLVFSLLLGDAEYPDLRAEIEQAVRAIIVPELNRDRTNQNWIAHSKRLRVQAALLLTVASPEFIVQH